MRVIITLKNSRLTEVVREQPQAVTNLQGFPKLPRICNQFLPENNKKPYFYPMNLKQATDVLNFNLTKIIINGDGYVALGENGNSTFYYYLKDHLGNVRSVITPDASNQPLVSQANDYFPGACPVCNDGRMSFESTLPNPGIRANYNKLKYNGKEEQEMSRQNLTRLDYGARFYDAQIGRFHSVDPVADNFSYQSPYVYASNNPIRYIDVMGLFAGEYINKNGRIIGNDGIDDQNIHIVSNKEDTKTIKKNNNAGRVTNPAEVEIDVTTNKTELAEALDVLNRTIENGGFAEESSVVTPEGDITRGKRGEITEGGIALATLPYVEGEDNTSIHSHPTGTTQTSGWSALRPGPGDPPAFRGFKRNIIVGALGDPKTDHSGNDIPRPHGAAFFGRNITTASKPKAVLYKNAIERV
jgi:RHS repeat-associated protein